MTENTEQNAGARILELEQESESLRARVHELEQEAAARPGGARPAPVRASFGMSEGVRAELELHKDDPDYKARDPFTGADVTPDDLEQWESDRDAARAQRPSSRTTGRRR